LAKQFGVSEDTIYAMADKEDNPELFTDKELVALEFAEVMSKDSNNVSEDLWNRLRSHFDEGEVVEIACVVGTFNYFNRFNNALNVDVTK
jgi:alkylhydroperoxidase family enzyme